MLFLIYSGARFSVEGAQASKHQDIISKVAKPSHDRKGDQYAHCSSKSPLFESHSVPCGCLATPLQHNILRINRVKRDRCLLTTTSQGCSPITNAFSQHCSNKSRGFITSWIQNQNNMKSKHETRNSVKRGWGLRVMWTARFMGYFTHSANRQVRFNLVSQIRVIVNP